MNLLVIGIRIGPEKDFILLKSVSVEIFISCIPRNYPYLLHPYFLNGFSWEIIGINLSNMKLEDCIKFIFLIYLFYFVCKINIVKLLYTAHFTQK